jgi:hypothetical protein
MNPDRRHEAASNPTPVKPGNSDNAAERAAKFIMPPDTEVSDKDIQDPGKMTPDAAPTDDRS